VSDEEPVRQAFRRYLEGAVTGLAYASALAALSVFAVGSFRTQGLFTPYWGRIASLRTDTFGFGCYVVATLAFGYSEFLRLSRIVRHRSTAAIPDVGPIALLVSAASRALVVAASVLVVYLSVNAVTHPQTLALPATHLLSWPTEGTLRAIALVVTALAVAVARIQRIAMSEG